MTTASDRQPTVRLPQQATPTHDRLPPGAAAPAPPAAPKRRRLLVTGLTVLALAAGAGAAAVWTLHGDIPRGVTVLGVDLGGRSRAGASAALHTHLASDPAVTAPVQLTVEGRGARLRPADIGLTVDVDATVDAASRGRPSLFGTRAVAPIVTVDAALLDAALRQAVGTVGTSMRAPAVTFTGLTPKAVHPRAGRGLDPRTSAQALKAGWLSGTAVTVPLAELRPATTAAEVDELVETVARPAVAAPVTVTSERGTLTIPPAAIAKSLLLTGDASGRIVPRFDPARLRAALGPQLKRIEVPAKDASFAFAGGKPTIVAGAEGRALDLAGLAPRLLETVTSTSGRTVAGSLTTAAPATDAADLQRLGITEKVSTFTTKFPGGLSSPRSQNIIQAAEQVRGALVLPGKTFSLNKHTGERGYRQGYKDAPVIVGGHLQPGVGGGVSQFTTTLFNATYYAGLKDVEHKPHSFYFDRYPAVIESTIFWPDLDFKFQNDSPYGVLIDTAHTSETITVSVWSTKVWDKVSTEWSDRRNVTSPPTITKPDGPSCIATGGLPGFTQDAWRLFHKGGKVVKREKFTWKYDPEPRFICS
ncbi:VanW family protein [Actinoplanes utahensis]|uniref:Vanomycin resistance protein VanB n=1 Tax=Actinoplanes utahensis TaxID=1869 RepID=A0A0A6UWJ5_ACTUT|nr:VanW family protein [Actinoplanes utahensis]KHD79263.1 vanomycin resistance protein VanB [Actinoplanes utahensis]GIF30308.1 vanomycin resistance protein VanB [Actinoplanes utahensis]